MRFCIWQRMVCNQPCQTNNCYYCIKTLENMKHKLRKFMKDRGEDLTRIINEAVDKAIKGEKNEI